MPSIRAFATAWVIVSVVAVSLHSKDRVCLTIGAVQKQDRVGTTQNRDQLKIQLCGISLFGM